MKKNFLSPTLTSTVGLYGYGNADQAASQTWHAMGGQGFRVQEVRVFPGEPPFCRCQFQMRLETSWSVRVNPGLTTLLIQLGKKESQNSLERLQKGYSFIRKILQHTSLWLQWLLGMTVALNWFNITLLIHLIWKPFQQQTCVQERFSWWRSTPFRQLSKFGVYYWVNSQLGHKSSKLYYLGFKFDLKLSQYI